MGYKTRAGTQITDFWPDDSETEIYIPSSLGHSMQELLEKAQEKWPGATLEEICISAEKIHTHCIYYDRYDPMDYTDFIILEYKPKS